MQEYVDQDYFINVVKKAGYFYNDNLVNANIPDEIIDYVPAELANYYKLIPVSFEDGQLVLVTSSVDTQKEESKLREKFNVDIKLLKADRDNVLAALKKYYGTISGRILPQGEQTIVQEASPLERTINDMLQTAAALKASDIHMLPTSNGFLVHFRIDGHMVDVSSNYVYKYEEIDQVTNLIKKKGTTKKMDSGNKNMPESGAFEITRGSTLIDVRVATIPVGNNLGWQKINIRLLPQTANRINLDQIGYDEKDLNKIRQILYKSASGLFLNSGPTGSGKTTSLYAQIYYVRDVKKEPLNIITIDNPIEIREESFTQVQVREASNEANNLTAQKILKVGLRSDPDIFLYNEIRDAEDATVALEASATGHRVFSTVHASDCIRTITRLLDLDISKATLLSELKMIISQRLVAKLCPKCSRPHILTEMEKSILSEAELSYLSIKGNLKERGSEEDIRACTCNNGYIGRSAVAEYVVFNMKLRDALMDLRSFEEIANLLRDNGFQSMWQKALYKVKKGELELKEAIQVIGKD